MTTSRLPIIGVTCSIFKVAGRPRVGQNQTYLEALVRAGAAPLLIPNLTDQALLRTVFESVDGLLFSGGDDVDPAHYGEDRHEKCGTITPERDMAELALIPWAIDEGKPILAICRGIQVLNVALGGSLYQDIQAQLPGAQKHDWHPGYPRNHPAHLVEIVAHTRLAHLLGVTSLPVNSLHHQAVKDVAPRLIVAGRTSDRIVEAVEAEGHPFAIGVQWHPEELAGADPRAQRLFDALVQACRADKQ
jgi:putative glutamine amidotransferase